MLISSHILLVLKAFYDLIHKTFIADTRRFKCLIKKRKPENHNENTLSFSQHKEVKNVLGINDLRGI